MIYCPDDKESLASWYTLLCVYNWMRRESSLLFDPLPTMGDQIINPGTMGIALRKFKSPIITYVPFSWLQISYIFVVLTMKVFKKYGISRNIRNLKLKYFWWSGHFFSWTKYFIKSFLISLLCPCGNHNAHYWHFLPPFYLIVKLQMIIWKKKKNICNKYKLLRSYFRNSTWFGGLVVN